MLIEDFTKEIIEIVKRNAQWHRVVSIDLETDTFHSGFLNNERILAVGIAHRVGGKIVTRTELLEEETDEAEFELLRKTGAILKPIQPLVLIGYNITGYDFPLMNIKLKKYDDFLHAQPSAPGQKPVFPREYWALKDSFTRSCILDVMHSVRFLIAKYEGTTAKYISLEKAIAHPLFSDLPLMMKKHLAHGETKEEKGKIIYEMWKGKDNHLSEYLEADVHDTLLIAERMFRV